MSSSANYFERFPASHNNFCKLLQTFARKRVVFMIQYERQRKLLEIMKEKRSATIKELAKLIYVSEASVRRDIEQMENMGLVSRVYGGVVLLEHKNSVVPLSLRDVENHNVKDKLARRAAEMIPDGATVFIDSSSTTWRIVKYIGHCKDLRIVTNSLTIFKELKDENVEAYCTGGIFRPQTQDFVGFFAENYIRSVNADIVFFSAQAISNEGEISDVSAEWTSLRRAMIDRAKKRVFLCDSSKIGLQRAFKLCTKDEVDEIICDVCLPWQKK